MRPSVPEQLEGLRRILSDVVAPEVHDPYPADILAGVMASLDSLGRVWYELPRYLQWDCGATAEVLAAARHALPDGLAASVGEALADPAPDGVDLAALEARHEHLRALLAESVPHILEDPGLASVQAQMVELFGQRTERFPFALIARPPAAGPASKPAGGN